VEGRGGEGGLDNPFGLTKKKGCREKIPLPLLLHLGPKREANIEKLEPGKKKRHLLWRSSFLTGGGKDGGAAGGKSVNIW